MAEEVSRATTNIVYDGPAIADGAMDVGDFAPALLSLSQLCKAANREINGNGVEVTTYIRADIRKGSFDFWIDLGMVASAVPPGLFDAAVGKIVGALADNKDAIASAHDLLEMIGIGGGGIGVFAFLKILNGRTPEKVEQAKGSTTITIGGDVIMVNDSVFQLSQNAEVRRAIEGVVKPLHKEGIDTLKAGEDEKARTVIATADDAHSFASPIESDEVEGEILADSETIAVLGVVRPYLGSKGHRWGLHDGFGVHGYEIKDDDFLDKVNRGVYKFGRGDAIRVRLRRRTWMDPKKGLQATGIILKVLGKIDAPEQMSLLPPPKSTQRRR